jgi:GTP cyclohydrolase I
MFEEMLEAHLKDDLREVVGNIGMDSDVFSLFSRDVATSFEQIIDSMGKLFRLNVKNKNFKDTPKRVGAAYCEIFSGLLNRDIRVKAILSATFPGRADEMVVVGPVHVWSMCPHHFLPVEMNIWVGYLPNGKVLGLSKLARLSELLAKKPSLQEDTTVEIAETLFTHLKPKGAACLIKGRHLCMEMRGAKQRSITTTTSLLGAFRRPATREEFLRGVNGSH